MTNKLFSFVNKGIIFIELALDIMKIWYILMGTEMEKPLKHKGVKKMNEEESKKYMDSHISIMKTRFPE